MPTVMLDGLETYYEVRGPDEIAHPVLVMGGWGTFTGDDLAEVPRGIVTGASSGPRTIVTFDWHSPCSAAVLTARSRRTRCHRSRNACAR